MIKISRTNAVNKVKDNCGEEFTIKWTKNNGKEREVTGKSATDCVTNLGYLTVETDEGFKSVNTKNILSIKINKKDYLIKR